jgi:uncharacterized protein (TIGR00299 family) protein
MGAAGDMLMAALLELHDAPQVFLKKLNNAGIPGVVVTAEPSAKCGITGTRVIVKIDGQEENCHHGHDHHHHSHSHSSYHDIEHLINRLKISSTVKQNAHDIYKLIAEAESHAHGVPVNQIHFHEVGEMDAVADIVGVCMLMEELSPDIIISSPINTGSGHVHCAHGILPVPAPATAHILRNIPIYNNSITGELCTPTGAAILKHLAKKYGTMPIMTVSKIGYGMGKKDFKQTNCVRAYIGNIVENFDANNLNGITEEIIELVCNLDDMTPESIAFAQELLLHEGALDVWVSPIGMKKGRQGIKFSCLCHSDVKEKILSLIFKHTSTLGVRENICRRYALQREQSVIETPHGTVRIKTAHGFGVKKTKTEYDDIAKIAREAGISIENVLLEYRPPVFPCTQKKT